MFAQSKHEFTRIGGEKRLLLTAPFCTSKMMIVFTKTDSGQTYTETLRKNGCFLAVAKMEETSAAMDKAKKRHDIVIKDGFGTGVRPYGHIIVHV
jgi:hypothetical protein